MNTLTKIIAVFALVVLSLATMVWEGRLASLKTAITRADVVSSCVRSTWNDENPFSVFGECLRAGFIVSRQRRNAFRAALALAELQKSFVKLDEAFESVAPFTNTLVLEVCKDCI